LIACFRVGAISGTSTSSHQNQNQSPLTYLETDYELLRSHCTTQKHKPWHKFPSNLRRAIGGTGIQYNHFIDHILNTAEAFGWGCLPIFMQSRDSSFKQAVKKAGTRAGGSRGAGEQGELIAPLPHGSRRANLFMEQD